MARLGFEQMVVSFDDGRTVEVQTGSRDLLKLEREGTALNQLGAVEGFYRLAHAALVRLEAFDGDVEALMATADIDVIQDPKAMGQDPIID